MKFSVLKCITHFILTKYSAFAQILLFTLLGNIKILFQKAKKDTGYAEVQFRACNHNIIY